MKYRNEQSEKWLYTTLSEGNENNRYSLKPILVIRHPNALPKLYKQHKLIRISFMLMYPNINQYTLNLLFTTAEPNTYLVLWNPQTLVCRQDRVNLTLIFIDGVFVQWAKITKNSTELNQSKINWTIALVIEPNRYFKNNSLTEPNGY
jgi:hypothetical protein